MVPTTAPARTTTVGTGTEIARTIPNNYDMRWVAQVDTYKWQQYVRARVALGTRDASQAASHITVPYSNCSTRT